MLHFMGLCFNIIPLVNLGILRATLLSTVAQEPRLPPVERDGTFFFFCRAVNILLRFFCYLPSLLYVSFFLFER